MIIHIGSKFFIETLSGSITMMDAGKLDQFQMQANVVYWDLKGKMIGPKTFMQMIKILLLVGLFALDKALKGERMMKFSLKTTLIPVKSNNSLQFLLNTQI